MRITEIAVKKLFGIYDHTIPLNLDDRITIMHGPNGTGKTTILRLVNDLFWGNLSRLFACRFDELFITFDDKTILYVRNHKIVYNEKTNTETDALYFELINQATQAHDQWMYPSSLINKGAKESRQLINLYIDQANGGSLSVPVERIGEPVYDMPDWLQLLSDNITTEFIQTQRLLTFSKAETVSQLVLPMSHRVQKPAWKETTAIYGEDLATIVQEKLAEMAANSQELDRTFPTRLLKQSGKKGLATEADMRERLARLEQKRKQLIGAGLLDPPGDQEDVFGADTAIDPETRAVLAIYLDDTEKKLGVFDDLYGKINALLTIINKRFLNKKMKIDKAQGFVFEGVDGTRIEPTNLSSGEQHELVLFYELLFRVPAGSLILIDEPEISLHVAWQIEFLRDLLEVARLADLDIVLATHSPQIINDRWDLTVELKGTPGERVPELR